MIRLFAPRFLPCVTLVVLLFGAVGYGQFVPTPVPEYPDENNLNTLPEALEDLSTPKAYIAALDQVMPTLYQSLSTLSFNTENAQNQQLLQRLWGLRLAQPSGSEVASSDKNVTSVVSPQQETPWGVFVDGNGIFAQATSGNVLPTYNSEGGGITAGWSYRWNDQWTTGLYSGYQGSYTKYTQGSTLVDNAVRFGLFGTYGQGHGHGWFLDTLVGGDYNSYTMRRNLSFGDVASTANGTPGAGDLDTMVATGYDIQRGHWTFGPTSSLQYLYFGAHSFTESGAQDLNLKTQGWNTSSMIYSLGSHVAYTWTLSKDILIVPQLSLNWQHEFLQNPYTISSNLGDGATFLSSSNTPLRDTLYTGLGVTVTLANRWDLSFFYNAAAGNRDLVSQNIFLGAGLKF